MEKAKKFEDKLKELEDMVITLESGEVGLEESINVITKASSLIKEMEKELLDTEDKLKILDINNNTIKDISKDFE
ncbi:MAG: exodeoxyribonuclease VII small subunit [Eubacteriaceae bacterium]|nr:exodeoxyribonuclease VII small subunit [Eubacteriaceae bacterium]